ncbi:MAG: hypothetical protein WHS87_05465, partial [Anaerolineales bacterium]
MVAIRSFILHRIRTALRIFLLSALVVGPLAACGPRQLPAAPTLLPTALLPTVIAQTAEAAWRASWTATPTPTFTPTVTPTPT